MRIFVFEYITGGGLLPTGAGRSSAEDSADRLDCGLLDEGRRMVRSLATDFAALTGCDVHILRDYEIGIRLPGRITATVVHDQARYGAAFAEQAAAADWTVVIAPECGGALLACAQRVLECGGRLLSPAPEIIRLTSDKHDTAEHLAAAGVPAPRGTVVGPQDPAPDGLTFPLVVKPRDGAGSQGVRLVRSSAELRYVLQGAAPTSGVGKQQEQATLRVEEYCPGDAVSVAFLCGPAGAAALAPCWQRLSEDGRFTYLGGSTPLPPQQIERATLLGSRAISTLNGAVGYIGVDLVLGADPAGAEDRVIEINPRLTTSYCGLRAAHYENLAQAMLDAAHGNPPLLQFRPEAPFTDLRW